MNKRKILTLLIVALITAGCSSKNEEDPLAAAKGYIDSKDFNSAIIVLKNNLVKNPEKKELRILLAESYFQLGLYKEAESSYKKINDKEYQNNKINSRLSEIYYLTADEQSLKELYNENITKHNEDVILFYILHLIEKGEIKSAKEKIKILAGLKAMPNTVSLLEKILNNEKNIYNISTKQENIYENILLARLYNATKSYKNAIENYNIFLEKNPKNYKFEYEKSISQILEGSIQDAKETLTNIPTNIQKSESIQALHAFINYSEGLYEEAKINAENALIQNKKNPQAKVLLAFITYKLGMHEQALDLLTRLDDNVFNSPQTLALISSILLNNQNHENPEISTLLSNAEKNYEAVRFLTKLIGNQKNSEDTLTIFENSLSENPNNPKLLEITGFLKIQNSMIKEGYSDLEKALKIDPGLNTAAALLSRHLLAQGKEEGALYIAKELKNAAGKKYQGLLLESQLYLMLKNQAKAIATLESIPEDVPEYAPAQEIIALAYESNNQIEKVLEHLFKSIIANPQTLNPYNKVVNIYQNGKNKAIHDFFNNNIHNINSLGFVLAYSDILLLDGDKESSIRVLHEAENRFSENYSYFIFKAKKQYFLTSQEDAFNSLQKAIKLNPTNMTAWEGLFRIHEVDDIEQKTISLINNEIAEQTDKNSVYIRFAEALIRNNKTSTAKKIIDSIPSSSDILQQKEFLLGLYYKKTNDLKKASEHFKEAYILNKSESNAIHYAGVLRDIEGVQAAYDLISKHIKEQSSTPLLETIKTQYNLEKDPKTALEKNRKLLASAPNNPAILNNAAWLETKHGDKKLGLTLAKKAAKLLPNHPTIMDTLATSLIANNEPQLALSIWSQLIQHIPGNDKIRLNYVEALIAVDQIEEARTVLQNYEPDNSTASPLYEKLRAKLNVF